MNFITGALSSERRNWRSFINLCIDLHELVVSGQADQRDDTKCLCFKSLTDTQEESIFKARDPQARKNFKRWRQKVAQRVKKAEHCKVSHELISGVYHSQQALSKTFHALVSDFGISTGYMLVKSGTSTFQHLQQCLFPSTFGPPIFSLKPLANICFFLANSQH